MTDGFWWTMKIDVLKQRARIMSDIRAFFDEAGFIEVETPVRITAPAPEPHIDCPPVSTGGFLRASPELQMKKLLAAGMDRIYQIGPCFRDGEKGTRHNPEFTMIEWYRRDAAYLDILADCENLYRRLSDRFCPAASVRSCTHANRIAVRDIYRKVAGWDPWTEWDQDRFDLDMAIKIEPALKDEGATFLIDYPQQAASLARLRSDVAERWEFYVDGIEIANCFSELCDSAEQHRRFEAARETRRQLGEADYPIDDEFLSSLDAIGSAAGVALGIDRLVMALLGESSIDAVRAVG